MTLNLKKYLEISNFVENFSNNNNKSKASIIAVTKTRQVEDVNESLNIGITHFGEIRVQEASKKFHGLQSKYKNMRLHMIGPLQSNKIKDSLKIFDYFHSLDRESLAKEFSKYPESTVSKAFFIQVNTGQEKQKSGINPNLTLEFASHCLHDLNLNIIGLMCLPPINDDPKEHFLMLNGLASKSNFKQLSMGMSNDYKIAIECGATFIRIGSSFFSDRE